MLVGDKFQQLDFNFNILYEHPMVAHLGHIRTKLLVFVFTS